MYVILPGPSPCICLSFCWNFCLTRSYATSLFLSVANILTVPDFPFLLDVSLLISSIISDRAESIDSVTSVASCLFKESSFGETAFSIPLLSSSNITLSTSGV